MRMDRRAGLLAPALPTFAELFATRVSSLNDGRNSSVKTTLSVNFNRTSTPIPVVGQTWYAFFAVGSSLEISRIDYTSSSSITKTRLSFTALDGATGYATTVSGTKLESADTIGGGQLTIMRFNGTYSPDIIDAMFKTGVNGRPQSYLSTSESSTSTGSSDTRIATSTITSSAGVILAMFYGTKYNFSVSACATPTTLITGASGGSISRTVLVEKTSGGTNYLYPTEDGSAIAGVRSYTLARFAEKW